MESKSQIFHVVVEIIFKEYQKYSFSRSRWEYRTNVNRVLVSDNDDALHLRLYARTMRKSMNVARIVLQASEIIRAMDPAQQGGRSN